MGDSPEKKRKVERITLTSIIVLLVIIIVLILCCCCKNRYNSISLKNTNEATAGRLSIGLKHNSAESTTLMLQPLVQPGDIITVGENNVPGMTKIEIFNRGNTDLLFLSNFEFSGDTELAEVFIFWDLKVAMKNIQGDENIVEHWLIKDGKILSQQLQGADGSVNGQKDGIISLAEWNSDENQVNGIQRGWDLAGLTKSDVYELSFTLVFDTAAGNEYQNKSIDITYSVLASQMREKALGKLMQDYQLPEVEDLSLLFAGINSSRP
ncbi:hypothetical protein HYG86_14865 [Alkalicella caledoniensis]|uniref:Uncharacterized protein n=1 Tax=Alkalicella caledoniensis TaxID=2731377 RepID=A0A7G9WB93_ALKCA|nr:hypothetical protein [Alkalicella caledoniensis]QNO15955.1 hypothetical protein HYG86_14865 [Alkalicella caledoniensis]